MPARDVEILVCTLGTRGDILPFLGLARPFVEAGHCVTVLSNRNWKALVQSIGAEFHAIAEQDPPQDGRDDQAFYRENTYPSFARSFSIIAQRQAANPRCLLLYRFNMLGAECAAEKFRLPNVKVALQPSVIKSVERPPWPLTALAHGPWRGLAKALLIPALYRLGEIRAAYRLHGNRFRRQVGLAGLTPGAHSETEDLYLVLCPDWFAMPQKDWPSRARVTGFVYFDRESPNEALDFFLAAHAPPIVFTPGTGISDTADFFRTATEVCRQLRIPAVFLGRLPSGMTVPEFPPIMVCDYAELHRLLPRCRMLVHHGGIGSTAQAIRAGIPQLILPNRFDQPDNGLRVAILGLGGAVFSTKPSPADLAGLIGKILGSAAVRRQVETGSRLIQAQGAQNLAHRMIADLIHRRFGEQVGAADALAHTG